MKAVLVVTDSEAVPVFERAFVEQNRGFTVIPELIGMGRGGLKAGDRVHPGGSSLLFTVVPDKELGETVSLLKQARAAAECGEHTRMWSFGVDEVTQVTPSRADGRLPGREVDLVVTLGRKPWFAVEAKLSANRVDPALLYFKDRLGIPFDCQVTLAETRDIVDRGVRILPAIRFLAGLA